MILFIFTAFFLAVAFQEQDIFSVALSLFGTVLLALLWLGADPVLSLIIWAMEGGQ